MTPLGIAAAGIAGLFIVALWCGAGEVRTRLRGPRRRVRRGWRL